MGRTGGPTQLRQRCWRRSTAILGNPNPGLSQDLALNKTWLSLISGLNFQNFKKTQGIDRLQDTKIQLLAQRNQLLVQKWLNQTIFAHFYQCDKNIRKDENFIFSAITLECLNQFWIFKRQFHLFFNCRLDGRIIFLITL